MQKLLVFQSMWAMERRHSDGYEASVEQKIEKIHAAGFDGISADWRDPQQVRRMSALLRASGLRAEGQCFPKTVDDLKPVLENAVESGLHHLDIQPDVRPRRIQDCIPLLEGWRRLAEEVDFPVYIETHRDRMTTDLYFTLDLLDCFPDLKLLGDVSHFLVGREFAWPINETDDGYIKRILDNSWAFHGRVASREQVQIEISFPHHKPWLDLFLGWWEYGFKSWMGRADPNATLAFVCELGPKPYAITGRDGNDTTDRWSEALMMRDLVRDRWDGLNGP
ncbi:sugar phosphate isomerase/epimerase family protein [Phyllobacterium chamaecytisi]|uniref:sugar phosphate isomerase/epimerase family protein n=1 Tax=Phyllobacterium chamaecytisi TaxID=2876082 RepID=UPI001CD01658|nr:sugar phosphate isomerase/epimerase [Phyllobacterium sp. KW56]MBZ9603278.1 sugar phosphate isomerase/epimerase [Phyllobacterium sp. KW56]